jgi:hypothetical protein
MYCYILRQRKLCETQREAAHEPTSARSCRLLICGLVTLSEACLDLITKGASLLTGPKWKLKQAQRELELLAPDTKNRYPLGRSLNETETLMAVRDYDIMEYSYDCGWSSCPSYRGTRRNLKLNATALVLS